MSHPFKRGQTIRSKTTGEAQVVLKIYTGVRGGKYVYTVLVNCLGTPLPAESFELAEDVHPFTPGQRVRFIRNGTEYTVHSTFTQLSLDDPPLHTVSLVGYQFDRYPVKDLEAVTEEEKPPADWDDWDDWGGDWEAAEADLTGSTVV